MSIIKNGKILDFNICDKLTIASYILSFF